MKKSSFFAGIQAIMLVFGLILTACQESPEPGPAVYIVSFNPNGGTIISGQPVQEVEEGKYASIPTVTPPAGKEADGWDSSAASIASPASPITSNVTFTAKWKDKANDDPLKNNPPPANPLLGAWYNSTIDEFLVFTPSVAYYVLPMKETPIDTTNQEITLGNEDSLWPATYKYELQNGKLVIKNSYVVNNDGEPADLPLTRLEGSTKTGVYDLWYSSDLTSTHRFYTILIIRSNGDVWAAVGVGTQDPPEPDFARWPYEVKDAGAAKPYIKWADAASGSTDFSIDGNQLTMKWSNGEAAYTKITL
jgi:hypothetical protein